jgi:DNA polymerase bacteriophage-type
MGPDKFGDTMKAMGIVLSSDECFSIVRKYRDTNRQITKLWKDAGAMLEYMTRGTAYHFGKYGVLKVDPDTRSIWLPSGLALQYPGLSPQRGERGWEYTYDTRKGPSRIYGGKVVENCLAGDTDVLTDMGWIPLRDVTLAHRLWDGVQWVQHDGLIYQGKEATTIANGVRMTPDHNVLTERGWRCASSSEGLHRAGFWLPDGSEVSGGKWATLNVGLPVQLWGGSPPGGHRRRKICPRWWAPIVRMQSRCREQVAWLVEASRILGLAINAGPLPLTYTPSMAQLRGPRHPGLLRVGAVIRGVLGGHGPDVPGGPDTGSGRQQRGLHPGELPVGDERGAGREPAQLLAGGYSKGTQGDWHFQIDAGVSVEPEPVYDILNAGPNSRFVVRGHTGPFIVHNCVQALARVVVAEQMLRIKRRYPVAMTVHDSAVVPVRDEEVAAAKPYVEACMRWVPQWATGLPVDCELGVGKNYGETE